MKKTVTACLLAAGLLLGGAPMATADTPPPGIGFDDLNPAPLFCFAYPDFCKDEAPLP